MASKGKDQHAAIIKRVSRRHDEEEHGGSWKVAFADFCLALMCLYMVLWVLAARQQEEMRAQGINPAASRLDEGRGRMPETLGGPRGSLIAYESFPRRPEAAPGKAAKSADAGERAGGPDSNSRTRYESPAQLHELAELLARMSEQAGLRANVQTVVTPYGLRIMVHDTDRQGMFELGSAVPTERFRQLLRRMGPLFARMENQLLIVGHTDSLQYAEPKSHVVSNWTLSSNRAAAARGHLIDGGMSPDSVLQVVGMAEQAPLDPRQPAASVNRRIELLVLTSDQARSLVSMFGAPDAAEGDGAKAVLPDVDATLPSPGVLSVLREQLRVAGQQLQNKIRPQGPKEEPARP